MILLADSGATKTDWLLADEHHSQLIKTEGINPFHQSQEHIEHIIKDFLMPQLSDVYSRVFQESQQQCDNQYTTLHLSDVITSIHFYGAGCLPSHIGAIQQTLHECFPKSEIQINTDLLGAARALCGHQPGIACILGTGANSCLYDGEQIQKNIPPLGYILGDEGSGAYLGKQFVSDCFKEQLPDFLREGLLEEYHLTYTDLINKVYKEGQANRFLASLTPYIYKNKGIPEVHDFLIRCFDSFFQRNILPYHSYPPLAFTGSVSWYFQEEIKEAASKLGLRANLFLKNPIEGMAAYHGVKIELSNEE